MRSELAANWARGSLAGERSRSSMVRTAIVTGGSKGIGRAIALRLAQDGARVVICARDTAHLSATVEDIEKTPGRALAISADLRDPPSAELLVGRTLDAFGA